LPDDRAQQGPLKNVSRVTQPGASFLHQQTTGNTETSDRRERGAAGLSPSAIMNEHGASASHEAKRSTFAGRGDSSDDRPKERTTAQELDTV
jgi:hypothetical protein